MFLAASLVHTVATVVRTIGTFGAGCGAAELSTSYVDGLALDEAADILFVPDQLKLRVVAFRYSTGAALTQSPNPLGTCNVAGSGLNYDLNGPIACTLDIPNAQLFVVVVEENVDSTIH